MITHRIVTATDWRRKIDPESYIRLPELRKSVKGRKLRKELFGELSFCFGRQHSDIVDELCDQLDRLHKERPNGPEILRVLRQIKEFELADRRHMTAHETWCWYTYKNMYYCFDECVEDTIIRRLRRYKGKILEAMCGFNSYFPRSKRRKVTALDFCGPALERYPYPERVRIECNLDQITKVRNRLHFIEDESFDAVSICYGFKYPKHIANILHEFLRILKPGGTLSFIEAKEAELEEVTHRRFTDGKRTKALFRRCGFEVTIEKLEMPCGVEEELGEFFHIQATKPLS